MCKNSFKLTAVLLAGTVLGSAMPAFAQDYWRESISLYGTPRLIEMPSAQSAPDGMITSSVTGFGAQQRINFIFQTTPRLSGTFRYTHFEHIRDDASPELWGRSFDLNTSSRTKASICLQWGHAKLTATTKECLCAART